MALDSTSLVWSNIEVALYEAFHLQLPRLEVSPVQDEHSKVVGG